MMTDTLLKLTTCDEESKLFFQLPQKIYPFILDEEVPENATLWMKVDGKGEPVARAATMINDDGVGMVGFYETVDSETGREVLSEAVTSLKKSGCETVIGPINGNTWNRYRLQTGGSTDPVFLMEPFNPAAYVEDFCQVGFYPVETYQSRVVDNLSERYVQFEDVNERLEANGYSVEKIDLIHFEATLKEVFNLSLQTFSENRFYSPIHFEGFRDLYVKAREIIDPDLVTLIYDSSRNVVAFIFALPDLLSLEDGKPQRIVMKTMAVDRSLRGMGIGSFLMDEIHQQAEKKGYKQVIHALMIDDNHSLKASLHYPSSRLLRSYALYQI